MPTPGLPKYLTISSTTLPDLHHILVVIYQVNNKTESNNICDDSINNKAESKNISIPSYM
jgi:hypothetical protein